MPTIDDAFRELQNVNLNLQQLQACCNTTNQRLGDVINTLNAGFTNMSQGFQALIALEQYANNLLEINANQNGTIICNLEKISEQTCNLLNEAHTQTGLQTSIEESSTILTDLYKTTHSEAALILEREKKLRQQIEECCPPEEPEPICTYEPCGRPPDFQARPLDVSYPEFEPVSEPDREPPG